MKSLIGALFGLLLVINCTAQSMWDDEYVVMVSKLNMRERASVDSRILVTLEWGDSVFRADIDSHEEQSCDTINDIKGCWLKVQHDNNTGYVFSPYVRMSYLLAFEDYYLTELPKYKYWYGVYYDEIKQTESIKRIKPRLELGETDSEGHKHTRLKTDQAVQSLFIIGTFDSIPEKEIGTFMRPRHTGIKCTESLKPGDIEHISSTTAPTRPSATYAMYTTGTYKLNGNDMLITNHDIVLVGNTEYSNQNVVQNMKNYFGNKEAYTLHYFGDIDGDNRPDLIMSGASIDSGGGTILFLSSRAKEGELLRPVAGFEAIDEC